MIFSTVSLAFALVCTSLASPVNLQARGSKVILGYRTVSKDEGDKINSAKTLIYDASKATGSKQNGDGVYLTQKLGQWPGASDAQWCRVLADKDEIEDAKKAWIKQDTNWNENAVANAIDDLDDDWEADKTLRLSKISGFDYLQMVIPKGLIGTDYIVYHTNGPLDIEAECRSQSDWASTDRFDADWTSGIYEENVKGDKQ